MYIVLDSNIWFSELGLSSAKGAALQFYTIQRNATLAVPEVIKREVEINTRKSLKEYCDDITKNHRQLLSIFGRLKEVVLPTDEEIEQCVNDLFGKVSAEVEHIPFCLESANQSLTKVLTGSPPSGPKNQQFKDGVIWADCMDLLDKDDVVFVTSDSAFYQDRKSEKGLVANLKEEASARSHNFRIFPSLLDLLEKIKEPAKIDKQKLVEQFCEKTKKSYTSLLQRTAFEIDSEPDVTVSFFVTEKADLLYINFGITYVCTETTDEGRTQPILKLNGDAFYNIKTSEFSNIRNQGEELTYIDASGEQKKNNIHIMAGNVLIGHRTVEHVVRHEIK